MVKLSYDERNGSRSLLEWGFGDPVLGRTVLEREYLEADVETEYEKRVRGVIVGVDDL